MKFTSLASHLVGSLFALAIAAVPVMASEEVPVTPTDTGRSVHEVVFARPFALDQPFTYDWSAEREAVSEGHILVVAVDAEMAKQRQTWMPVLYVGHRPAMVVNHGWETGLMVVVTPETDLASVPVFFGSVQLPEAVDAVRGREEIAAALELGIEPLGVERAATALTAGGAGITVDSDADLYHVLADVMEEFVPNESALIEDYRRIPTTR